MPRSCFNWNRPQNDNPDENPPADIENQHQAAQANDRYQIFLAGLARWLPCIFGGAEAVVAAAAEITLGENRANALTRIAHSLFSCCFNGAITAIREAEVHENIIDLEDEIDENEDQLLSEGQQQILAIAEAVDLFMVNLIDGGQIIANNFLNHFLSRYTNIDPDTRTAILSLCNILAEDLIYIERHGLVNPIARISSSSLGIQNFIYTLFFFLKMKMYILQKLLSKTLEKKQLEGLII
jgi:hypothetical protein